MKVYELHKRLRELVESSPHTVEYEVCMEFPISNKGDEVEVIVIDSLSVSDYQEHPDISNEPVIILKLGEPYEWFELD